MAKIIFTGFIFSMKIAAINSTSYINRSSTAKQDNIAKAYNSSAFELPSYYYKPISFKGYCFKDKPGIVQSAWNKLRVLPSDYGLDNLHLERIFSRMKFFKKDFIDVFMNETGFPNLKKVSENIEKQIINNGHDIAKKYNTELLFAGYNKNCSVGQGLALPGSDCDGIFFVYGKNNYYSPDMRWKFRCYTDNRVLHVDEHCLPEVYNINEIKKGLALADKAFSKLKEELTVRDYMRFMENIYYDGTDYVKAAEFNIRLSKFIPSSKDKNFVAMVSTLPEYLRGGKILENNLAPEIKYLIRRSPLYKLSNITRQEGQTHCVKQKLRLRKRLEETFMNADIDEKFQLIKDICKRSFDLDVSPENEKYFINIGGDSGSLDSEMGNILSMYRQLRN